MCAEARARRLRLALLAFVVLLLGSRLAWIGDRQPHLDEMTHAALGERLALRGVHVVDPVYHGPLLYHLEAVVVAAAGPGLWQARLVPALAGILAAVWLALLVSRQAGSEVAVVAGALALISPSWLYYSRFAAHDTLMLLVAVAIAWSVDAWERGRVRQAVWVAAIALAAGWTTKLNVLFLGASVLGWGLLRWRVGRLGGSPMVRLPLRTGVAAAASSGAVVAALFICTFMGTLDHATWPEGLWFTIRRATVDGILHWSRMHAQQRIAGPADYYVLLVALYEPLLIVGVVALLWRSWRRVGLQWRAAVALLVVGSLAVAAGRLVAGPLASLSMRPEHLMVLPLVGVAAGVALWDALATGRAWLGWWIWLAATQTLLYAVAGEKTPWLVVHTVLPLLPLAAFGLLDTWRRTVSLHGRLMLTGVLAAGALVSIHGSVALTTYNRSNVGEPLVQVEYDVQAHAALAEMGRECLATPSVVPCVVTTPDARWPAEWYLRWHPAGTRAVTVDVAQGTATRPFVFMPAGVTSLVSEATHEPRRVRFASTGRWLTAIRAFDAGAVIRFVMRRQPLGVRVAVPYVHWRLRKTEPDGARTVSPAREGPPDPRRDDDGR